jgi:outer membrane immunogenic protein
MTRTFVAVFAVGAVSVVFNSASFAADLAQPVPAAAPIYVKAPAAPMYNWTGFYIGGFAGAAVGGDVTTSEELSTNVAPGSPYNAPGPEYGYNLNASAIGGGTLGYNWQPLSSPIVLGLEGEVGYIHLAKSTVDPNSIALAAGDTGDSTTIGDWYGIIAGRAGYAANQVLFYAKGGAAFTDIKSAVTDTCSIKPCGPTTLTATGTGPKDGWAAGGGIEYAFARNWTIKGEYLFLDFEQTYSVCGPGGGGNAVGVNFCANRSVGGISTGKIGVNYRF